MHNFKSIVFFCALFLIVQAVSPVRSQEPDGSEPPQEQKRFVRMDLLVVPERTLERSQRNIFTVRMSGGVDPEMNSALRNRENIESNSAALQDEQARFSVNIRYMGYVKSGFKITALIVFEGEALAVDKGEMIALDLQIAEISTEEIQVIGPDRAMLTFPLEGDRL